MNFFIAKTKFLNKRNSREHGAVMVEFGAVFLVFMFLVIGIIDFARYTEAKGVLNSGALDSIALATTIQGLDVFDRTTTEFAIAFDDVRKKALEIPRTALFSATNSGDVRIEKIYVGGQQDSGIDSRCQNNQDVCIILPEGIDEPKLREAFSEEPMRIILTGTYNPIFPGAPDLPIKVVAAGFREPRTTFLMPSIKDCNGNLFGSSNFKGTNCCTLTAADCTGAFEWLNTDNCACECLQQRDRDPITGFCGCDPSRNLIDTGSATCACAQPVSCPAGRITHPYWCDSCTCADANGADLSISCSAAGGTVNQTNCTCVCPDGSSPGNGICPTPPNPGGNPNQNPPPGRGG